MLNAITMAFASSNLEAFLALTQEIAKGKADSESLALKLNKEDIKTTIKTISKVAKPHKVKKFVMKLFGRLTEVHTARNGGVD